MKHLYLFILSLVVAPLAAQQLTDVTPNSGNVNTSLTLTVSGTRTNFTQGSQFVYLEQGSVIIFAEETNSVSNTVLQADFTLTNIFGQYTPKGWYGVVHSDDNFNTITLDEGFYIDYPVSVDEKPGVEALNIYPNPVTDGRFTLEGIFHDEFEMVILDMTGKIIKSEIIVINKYRTDVEINNFSPGTYILILQNKEERIARKLILR